MVFVEVVDEAPIRMRVTVSYEYDAYPSDYGGTTNPYDIAMRDSDPETIRAGVQLEDKLTIRVGPA